MKLPTYQDVLQSKASLTKEQTLHLMRVKNTYLALATAQDQLLTAYSNNWQGKIHIAVRAMEAAKATLRELGEEFHESARPIRTVSSSR